MTPEVAGAEIEKIKRLITTAGHLRFRIVADLQHDEFVCRRADDPSQAESRIIKNREGKPVAEWVTISKDENGNDRLEPDELVEHKIRPDPRTGETEILMLIDPFNVEGQHLARAWAGYDAAMRPCVHFTMNGRGAILFGAITGANIPDHQTHFYRKLGIIMDEKLLSAPRIMSRISDRGQITGQFTQQEVDWLAGVLNGGRLPAYLNPMPISEHRIRSGERIQWALWSLAATFAALLLIGVGTVIRYGRCGVAAALAAWLAAAMFAAGLLVAGVAFTFTIVVAACAIALALALALAGLCGVARNGRTSGKSSNLAGLPAPSWVMWVVGVFAVTFMAGAVTYVLGLGGIRRVAMLLVMGSLSGLVSAVLCFWPLERLFVKSSHAEDTDTGVITAEMSGDDSGAG
jgi:SecD/SecF fusion protein